MPNASSFEPHLFSEIVGPFVLLTLWPSHTDREHLSIRILQHGTSALLTLGQDQSVETTEILGVTPRSEFTVLSDEEVDAKLCPSVLVVHHREKADIRHDVAHPVWHMEYIFQADYVAFLIPWGTTYLYFDRANASNGNLTLIGNCEDVRLEGDICFEGRTIDGNMDVRGCREDPVITLLLLRLFDWHAVGNSASVGVVRAWMDVGKWQVTTWIKSESHCFQKTSVQRNARKFIRQYSNKAGAAVRPTAIVQRVKTGV